MSLSELLGWGELLTHRQYQVWQAWLLAEWNYPDRTDNYLMSIAAEIRRTLVKQPRSVDANDFRLRFQTSRKKQHRELTKEQATTYSKAAWIGRAGGKVKIKKEEQPPSLRKEEEPASVD